MSNKPIRPNRLKERIHEVIFEADTIGGKTFDVILLICILISVLSVMLESVSEYGNRYTEAFFFIEWTFTILFTIEYLLRLYSVYRPRQYALSFYGVIDLLAILPTYLSLIFIGSQYLMVIRGLRLLRIFRIFKLGHFLREGDIIHRALLSSRAKITVFLTFVLLMVIIIGSVMYLVEGDQNQSFSSIPRAVYWAVVTLTTVGYGDIIPVTNLGQFLSAIVMIMGYAIIAVPTGIVSAEMVSEQSRKLTNRQACRYCGREGHDNNARYCKYCGKPLNPEDDDDTTS